MFENKIKNIPIAQDTSNDMSWALILHCRWHCCCWTVVVTLSSSCCCCCGGGDSNVVVWERKVGVTKSSRSVRVFNINKSCDQWTHLNTHWQKTIKIIAKTVDNHCKYIVVIYTNKTGSQKICKPQNQGPDFLRTGKTMTTVLPGLDMVRSGSRSFLVRRTRP
jgi:hypothetical protein